MATKKKAPDDAPQAKKDEVPALFVRTRRGIQSRRRAGFRFHRDGFGIALDALLEEQIAALKADPALEVEECSFPADELIRGD